MNTIEKSSFQFIKHQIKQLIGTTINNRNCIFHKTTCCTLSPYSTPELGGAVTWCRSCCARKCGRKTWTTATIIFTGVRLLLCVLQGKRRWGLFAQHVICELLSIGGDGANYYTTTPLDEHLPNNRSTAFRFCRKGGCFNYKALNLPFNRKHIHTHLIDNYFVCQVTCNLNPRAYNVRYDWKSIF